MIKKKDILNLFKKWFFLIVFICIFFCLFFYYIYIGVLGINIIKKSIIILLFISFYKLMLEIIIFNTVYFKYVNKILINLKYYLLKKNRWLIEIIYYILYYFPTNWPYLIIMWLGRKWWDIRLFINSNKDIIGKKYFKKDWSKKGSPLNNKYLNWIKKNIINVFLRIFFLPLFFKLTLLTKSWNIFFILRIFGIIYSAVLLVNNLHIFVWFKNTEILSFWLKIGIFFFILYIYLYFLPFIVKKVYGLKWENGLKTGDKFDFLINTNWIYLIEMLNEEEMFIKVYYDLRKYLLFFLLYDLYDFFISTFYNKYYFLSKKSNIDYASFFIKLGKLGIASNLHLKEVEAFKNNLVFQSNSNIDILWICEKNYNRVSFFLYGHIIIAMNVIYDDFIEIMVNYNLFKILFGDILVKEYFEKEINELEDYCFIILIWYYYYEYLVCLGINNVPNNINNNLKYNNILNLSNFLFFYNKKWLTFLDYKMNFETSFRLDIIKGDSLNEFENFKTKEELLNFYIKISNTDLNDENTRLRLAIFDSNLYQKSFDRFNNLKNISKLFFEKNKSDNFLKVIEDLQNNYVITYKNIEYSSFSFLDNVKMKKEWKSFDVRIK